MTTDTDNTYDYFRRATGGRAAALIGECIMKKCPRCKQRTLEDDEILNCLSKKDNKTYICQQCGSEEDAQGLIREP